MAKDKINPMNNPRRVMPRKCQNPKCKRTIPAHVAKMVYYKCPCGTVQGSGPNQRGGAR